MKCGEWRCAAHHFRPPTPAPCFPEVASDGIEPPFPERRSGVVPLDHEAEDRARPHSTIMRGDAVEGRRRSSRGGGRTHRVTRLSTWPLCRIAYSTVSAGFAKRETSCRPGGRTRPWKLMRLPWTLVRLRR